MKLCKISIKDLFGQYSYNLDLIEDSPVTIISAPNGMGKTTLLNLAEAAIEGKLEVLDRTAFSLLILEFEDGTKVSVSKDDPFGSLDEKSLRAIRDLLVSGAGVGIRADTGLKPNIRYTVNEKEIPLRFDSRAGLLIGTWLMQDNTGDIAEVFRDIFDTAELRRTLAKYFEGMEVCHINASRLMMPDPSGNTSANPSGGSGQRLVPTVKVFSDELKEQIQSARKAFADKAEELDRTFPDRVLEDLYEGGNSGREVYDSEEIIKRLSALEERRTELAKLGLITPAESPSRAFAGSEVPELTPDTRAFFTSYIVDNEKKLGIYDDLAARVNLFLTIINEKNTFTGKHMEIRAEEGIGFVSNLGREIPVEGLSSGEQNNLILFYELIFKCLPGSLVMIDEPEISLHISWQKQFIDELSRICSFNGLQAIVATHSPDIVGEHWDLEKSLDEAEVV